MFGAPSAKICKGLLSVFFNIIFQKNIVRLFHDYYAVLFIVNLSRLLFGCITVSRLFRPNGLTNDPHAKRLLFGIFHCFNGLGSAAQTNTGRHLWNCERNKKRLHWQDRITTTRTTRTTTDCIHFMIYYIITFSTKQKIIIRFYFVV